MVQLGGYKFRDIVSQFANLGTGTGKMEQVVSSRDINRSLLKPNLIRIQII
jgi:hypothetical protein